MSLATITARIIIAAEATPAQTRALAAKAKHQAISFKDAVAAEKARLKTK